MSTAEHARNWRSRNPEKAKDVARRAAAKSYAEEPEKWKARTRKWYAANKERATAYHKAYRALKREEKKAYFRKYYEENADHLKARAKVNGVLWCSRNPAASRAKSMRHTAAKQRATPKWANHEEIDRVYEECVRVEQQTGVQHHVDHVVPLQGKTVSGLHVEYNLQIMPGRENQSKGARFWPDMP